MYIIRATFPEAVIFNSIKLRNSCEYCENFFTRDFLDFSVEHMSSTTSILNAVDFSDTQRRHIFQLLNTRLEKHVLFLKNSKKTNIPSTSTIAVVAFSDSEANFNTSTQEISHQQTLQKIRHNYFKVTIYSILLHFSDVVVYVSKPQDKDRVLSWELPLQEVIDLSDTLARVPPTAYFKHRPMEQLLPKYALIDVGAKLKSTSPQQQLSAYQQKWQSYSSIFYTEGDQIVHLRKLRYFYQMFDASNGDFLFIPHRLQVVNTLQQSASTYNGTLCIKFYLPSN